MCSFHDHALSIFQELFNTLKLQLRLIYKAYRNENILPPTQYMAGK